MSDCYRYVGQCNFLTVIKTYFLNRTFRWQVAFRLSGNDGIVLKIFGLFLWKINRMKRFIQIPRGTKVGYGLYIGHGGPVIVNPTAKIGNNVNLSQFVTIGAIDSHAAVIGDNVYIGPNVCVIEDVVIGNNVTIGAGSVITKNIPNNATVAGNYAKVLNYKFPGRYVCLRWKGE